jgi:excisionase family DNA binding protein
MSDAAEYGPASGVHPSVLNVPDAARLLGVGRTLAYQLVRTGRWPTPVIRVGRLIKVPTQPLLRFLATGESRTM